MPDIKGIPQSKLDRLWMHLEKVEKMTGKPLLNEPEDSLTSCPVLNFVSSPAFLRLDWGKAGFGIYKSSDSLWWDKLPEKTRIQITKWALKKIKERANE